MKRTRFQERHRQWLEKVIESRKKDKPTESKGDESEHECEQVGLYNYAGTLCSECEELMKSTIEGVLDRGLRKCMDDCHMLLTTSREEDVIQQSRWLFVIQDKLKCRRKHDRDFFPSRKWLWKCLAGCAGNCKERHDDGREQGPHTGIPKEKLPDDSPLKLHPC